MNSATRQRNCFPACSSDVRCLLAIWAWLLPVAVLGAEQPEVDVRRDQDHYLIEIDARIEAPAARVMAVLQDFGRLPRLHESITRAEVLAVQDGRSRVHVHLYDCLLVFCMALNQTLVFETGPEAAQLTATMDPAHSDFSYGHMHWALREESPRLTRLHYQAEVVPDFWVPPFIGPWLLQRKFRKAALEMTDSLGRLAAEP